MKYREVAKGTRAEGCDCPPIYFGLAIILPVLPHRGPLPADGLPGALCNCKRTLMNINGRTFHLVEA